MTLKIGILEPEPRVCGPTNWAFNLKYGAQQLGHDVDVISFTKSGKSRSSWGTTNPTKGGRWWSAAPDVVVRTEQLRETLDAYDAIILPEIKVPLHDKTAKKDGVSPDYVRALVETKTPWSTALHGSMYPDKDTPFVPELLSSPSRGEWLVAMAQDSIASSRHFTGVDWVLGPMPYIPKYEIDAPVPTTGVVGTSGRFIFNKGQPIVALSSIYLDPSLTVEVWGACPVGQGPSPTYLIYEVLRDKYNARVKRYATNSSPDWPDGDIVSPFPWDARPEGGALVRYLGNYVDSAAIAARFEVHVNLTSWTFARGLVEYSSLEAMDAGALGITPRHLSDDQFRMHVLDELPTAMPSIGKLDSPMAQQLSKRIADEFTTCLSISPEQRLEIAKHNRSVLRTRNDPRETARLMIESALSAKTRSVFGSPPPPPMPPATELTADELGPIARGSSGASFVIDSAFATKTGNERVVTQGEWLSFNKATGLPEVFDVDDTGYKMELLSSVPWPLVVPSRIVEETVAVLERDIWSKPPVTELDLDLHLEKVDALATRWVPGIKNALLERAKEVAGLGVACLTHGDPTMDNVMLRGYDIVLIDPVPATPAVPDLRAVDLGKLLQSANGFEKIRYNEDFRVATRHIEGLYARLNVSEDEQRAAAYWCIVHFLRALPYVPQNVTTRLVRLTERLANQ